MNLSCIISFSVLFPSTNKCQVPSAALIHQVNSEGYISSYVTQKTSCGDSDNPWLLSADVGQRINITLVDFAITTGNSNDKNDFQCDVYAIIRDGSSTAITNTVCGGQKKNIVPVFISTSNSVEIKLVGKSIQQGNNEGQFLLKFTSKLSDLL